MTTKALLHQAIGRIELACYRSDWTPEDRSCRGIRPHPADGALATIPTSPLAMRIALHHALTLNQAVGFLSFGEPALDLVMRLMGITAGVPLHRLLAGRINEEDFPKLCNSAARLSHSKLVLSGRGDSAAANPGEAMRSFICRHCPEILVVDAGGPVTELLVEVARESGVPTLIVARGPSR